MTLYERLKKRKDELSELALAYDKLGDAPSRTFTLETIDLLNDCLNAIKPS